MSKRQLRLNSQATEAQSAMEAICSQFGMSKVKSEEDSWGLTLLYQNSIAGLQLQFSPGEQAGWRAVIGELVDGSFPKHPIHIKQDTNLQRFDLRDLAAERIQSLPKYQDKILSNASLSVSELTDIVSQLAADVCLGDFSVFRALQVRVLARAKTT